MLCRGKWWQYELIKVPEIESFFNIYLALSAKTLTVVCIFSCHLHIFYYSTLQNRKEAYFLFFHYVGKSISVAIRLNVLLRLLLSCAEFLGSRLTKLEKMNYSTFLLIGRQLNRCLSGHGLFITTAISTYNVLYCGNIPQTLIRFIYTCYSSSGADGYCGILPIWQPSWLSSEAPGWLCRSTGAHNRQA